MSVDLGRNKNKIILLQILFPAVLWLPDPLISVPGLTLGDLILSTKLVM